MSKRNRREHGRIISVETKTRGDALADDVAAGVTSITVEDAGDFDEPDDDAPTPTAANPLGWLLIGGQAVAYIDCDDETGVITLADPLAAAAEQGDPVQVWSDLYEEVVDYQVALVELDGKYDNPDPVVAEVAEGVGSLPEGDRGKAGESCTLHRVSEDEWEVVGVGGRGRQSQGIRFEQDDTYTLTAADITAGTATLNLSHRPIDEALTCVLAGVPQRPTEWAIDYDAQTLTISLDGWEQAGMVLWVHYAYRKGLAAPPPVMSTQTFYLPATLPAADATVAFAPEWELVNSGGNSTPAPTSVMMTLARGASVPSGGTFSTWVPTITNADAISMQYVSHEQVPSARTISGTFSAKVFSYKSSANDITGYMQFVVRVVSADGSTVRGYLHHGCTETTATATPGAQNEQLPERFTEGENRYWTNIALDPVAAEVGDRIVVEIGFRDLSSSGGSVWTAILGEQESAPGNDDHSYFEFNTNAGLA